MLDIHCTNEHTISPGQIFFCELLYIGVNQAQLKLWGEHGRNCHQTQWWQNCPLAHKLQSMLVTPESVRELRVNKKNFH
jgi:hypothetical protein